MINLSDVVSFILDVLLVAAAVVSYVARPRIGGQLARGLRILMAGVMVLGLAHLVETVLFSVFNVGLEFNEIAHRLLVVFGFVLIILGFFTMRRAFEE
jgi:glucose dehydrogenase